METEMMLGLNDFLALLPAHKCGLYLEHNPHRDVHESVEEYAAGVLGDDDAWVSAVERQKAIEADELWGLQWYPETPIGFHRLYASSLGALLAAVPAESTRPR